MSRAKRAACPHLVVEVVGQSAPDPEGWRYLKGRCRDCHRAVYSASKKRMPGDAECRYDGRPGHVHKRRDGRPCPPADCHAEHCAQVEDLGALSRAVGEIESTTTTATGGRA